MIWLILPRRYEVWPDHLRIVFPVWRWDIPFDTISAVKPARWWATYGYNGVRFATSPGSAIEVRRRDARLFGRPNIIISPADRDGFIHACERAAR